MSMTTQQTMNQALPRAAPTPVITQGAISPPSKRELASWWKKFRKTTEKEDEKRASFIFLELQGRSEAGRVGSNQLTTQGHFILVPLNRRHVLEHAFADVNANC